MGYEAIRNCSDYKEAVLKDELANEFGEFIYNEMYEGIEILGKIWDNREKELESENSALQEKLDIATKALEMVEDTRKMPHQHKDYYERLCCLAERAREALEEISG